MRKSKSENIAIVGKISLTKRLVSRRQPPVTPHPRPQPAVELLGEDGEPAPFERYQLSSVGAYLYSEYLHCEGETLTLRLTLPPVAEPLIVTGEVVSACTDGDAGMGIAFRNMKRKEKRLLQEYVARKFVNHVK
ncbi:MAG: PilZ domain-containing protein [Deltaproteobacteria bacterium]|nr:PilZ domain-containing protein [Deltaproteobacteria bacterium]MBN2670448.1 PilZ domain-containing protein [Deltaproteobacteria bacterium]